MKSAFLNLNLKDWINAAIRAGVISFLMAALQIFQAGSIEWTFAFWQPTIYTAIAAVIGSLIKSMTTNSGGDWLKKEQT